MKQKKKPFWTTHLIVLTGVFAALVTIGTSIRIPLPALTGNPFVHFGSSIFILSVLILGYWPGVLAGGIGFAVFDILNGYATEAPYFPLECLIVAFFIVVSAKFINTKSTSKLAILVPTFFAGLAKLMMTFFKNLVMMLYMGSQLNIAIVGSFSTLYITFVNVIISLFFVSLVYFPLNKIIQPILTKKRF